MEVSIMIKRSRFSLFIRLAVILALLALALAGCAPPGGNPSAVGITPSPAPEPAAQTGPESDPTPIVITEIGLAELLSQGLPVILNFGDDSPDSLDTLAALALINGSYGDKILIRSVDLALKPDAREGFPVQIVPSQFFYASDGEPIPLPVNLGVLMSIFLDIETEEPNFTIHEGPLTEIELLIILDHLGIQVRL